MTLEEAAAAFRRDGIMLIGASDYNVVQILKSAPALWMAVTLLATEKFKAMQAKEKPNAST